MAEIDAVGVVEARDGALEMRGVLENEMAAVAARKIDIGGRRGR